MSDADLDNFNSGLQAVIDSYAEHCGAMNVRVRLQVGSQMGHRCCDARPRGQRACRCSVLLPRPAANICVLEALPQRMPWVPTHI